MGRVILALVMGCGVWLAASSTGSAKEDGGAEKSRAAIQQELAEREKVMRTWRAKLTGTEWNVELAPMRGKTGKSNADVLIFTETTVGSKKLLKAGYADAGSYALHSPTDKSVAWEAMQLKDDQGAQDMAIWRGEVLGGTMQGTLTKQRNLGDANLVEQFSFTGNRIGPEPEIAPEPEAPSPAPAPEAPAIPEPAAVAPEAEAPAAPAAAEPEAAQAVEEPEPKKKKKGWW